MTIAASAKLVVIKHASDSGPIHSLEARPASSCHQLNLLAGVLAAAAAMIVYYTALLALRMREQSEVDDRSESTGRSIGAAAGALAFAFGNTTWEYAVMYTPYILTAVFTSALLYVLLRWWQCAEQYESWK